MFTLLKTFATSLMWYAILTLPSLLFPPMYFMSLVFALQVCWVAGLFFILIAYLLKQLSIRAEYKVATLYPVALLGVWIAFLFIEIFKLWKDIWNDVPFLLFPLAAFVAACTSIYKARYCLADFFNDSSNNETIVATGD